MRRSDGGAGDPAQPGNGSSGYRPGYEVAAERILELIADRHLDTGDRLGTEHELADALQVSRTVTREAVKILSALGRVSVRKGSGVHVADVPTPLAQQSWNLFLPADPEQVDMLFELRRVLEREAGRLAAARATPQQVRQIQDAAAHSEEAAKSDDFDAFRRADEDFHRSVAAASGNMFLESTVSVVTQLKRQVLTLGLRGNRSGSLLLAAKQHRTITDAISQGDPLAASDAMAEHIDVTVDQFRQEIQRWMLNLDGPSRPGE